MEFARPLDSSTSIKPSFFDLISQSNFETLIQSLFEPTFSTSKYRRLIYFGVKSLIDLTMLAGFGGITSEVIYGLERRTSRNKAGKWIIYLVTVFECHLIPFLQLKLPEKFAKLEKLAKILNVIVKLAYITSDSKSFSLIHFLTGMFYEHSRTDIYEGEDKLSKIVKTILIGGQLAVYLIQSGVFEKNNKNSSSDDISITQQHQPDISKLIPKNHPNGFPIPKRAGICPCCLDPWKEPIVISSGYIYCAKCIKNYKSCPVTKNQIINFIPLFLQ